MQTTLVRLCSVAVLLCAGCSSSDNGTTRLDLTTHFFEGSYELSGTVTFSQPVAQGTRLQLMLTQVTDHPSGGLDIGNEAANRTLGSTGAEIPWAIHAIGAGDYWVSVAADSNHSNWIDEGDSGGYYKGTVDHPLQMQAQATKITVTNTSISSLDFGAGPMQCLAKWGEACTQDGDCRGAACAYPNSLRVSAVEGSCVDKRCAEPNYACPELSGSAGTLQPVQCLGGL